MISCDQYDYIEIVCTFNYPIKLTMKSGREISGVGLDTKLNGEKQECVKVDIDGVHDLVVLDEISTLEISVDNPHFKVISFG